VAQSKGEYAAGVVTAASAGTTDYKEYQSKIPTVNRPLESIELAAENSGQKSGVNMVDGMQAVLHEPGESGSEWQFSVSEDAAYQIRITYYALPGKGKDINLTLELDGAVPFEEAARLRLSRIWKDETKDGEWLTDGNGNELRPKQTEVFRWQDWDLFCKDGYYNEPFLFYFSAGTHTIRLIAHNEPVAIARITLLNREKSLDYQTVRAQKGGEDAPAFFKKYQAEKTLEKSSSMIYPTSDRTTPATEPSHYSKMRLNTIGQQNWKFAGEWISWEVEVPVAGWYEIAFKAKQSQQKGLNSYRTLYVNDEIQFAECENIAFAYSLRWQMKVLGDKTPVRIYLNSGVNTLRLVCSPGPLAQPIKELDDAVLDLNALYRKIIMITGPTPDPYRTYDLQSEIPGLRDQLAEVCRRLEALSAQIKEIIGRNGSQASAIDEVVFALIGMINYPDDIPGRISGFRAALESIGAVPLMLAQQPLELDYIVISSGMPLPKPGADFFESVKYHTRAFIASFFEDYNSIGSVYKGEAITVWISGGRDQAQIINGLINDRFTVEHGMHINLSLVPMNTGTAQSPLIQATLAGQGPDVAMLTTKDIPINLAMRGALIDLSKLDGFDSLKDRFFDSAWIPYRYKGGVYGLPETQNFDMLFYRTDIFKDLGLSVPNTWDDFYHVMAVLQKNNLQIGIPETLSAVGLATQNVGLSAGIGFFDKLLYQNGGAYFNDDYTKTALDSQVAFDAFKKWTDLYVKYGLDRQFDFFNRFRTGEIPMGLQPYTMYNQLYHAAPEIRGLWEFAPIPGTRMADGSINRAETADGSAAVLLKNCKNIDGAFQFMKWWTSSEIQALFGNELESIMGPAARYHTANVEAFRNLPWSMQEAEILLTQWEHVTDTPQIPGNYYIMRCLTSAFRAVVDEDYNPVFILNSYNKDMNAEIARKRKEFE